MAELQTFMIEANEYLKRPVKGFYRCDYLGYRQPNNPDYLVILKNLKNDRSEHELDEAMDKAYLSLLDELTQIIKLFDPNKPIAICVVPRSKARHTYSDNQLLFLYTIQYAVEQLQNGDYPHIIDGTDFLIRTINTRTTHLNKSGCGGDGDMPYPGIAEETCDISTEIAGKQILLIDDIYTRSINIDEDFLQTLINHGAIDVMFFAIGRTKLRSSLNRYEPEEFLNF